MNRGVAVGALLGGRYRLRFHLASGGMAEVWCADDEILGRVVAVKILHGHVAVDPVLRARFHTEAVAAARLVHPSIVSIFDTCEVGASEAIVMELVRGRTLREYLDERGRLEPIEVVHIGAEVASALSCAHRAGVIHRDIKPANILLSDDGRVLVTDFGIAKVLDEPDLTRTNQLIGTVKYLAPEQVSGSAIDARTDIYALGAVLYESLCGSPPFVGDNTAAVALARLQRDPLPASFAVDDLPDGLEALLARSLARSPDARFTTADDLRAALLSIRLDGDNTVAMTRPNARDDVASATGLGAASEAASEAGRVAERMADRAAPRSSRSAVLVSLVVVTALVLIALLVSSTDVGRTLFATDPTTTTTAPPASLALRSAHSFDPMGSGEPTENESAARDAIDGDPLTSWRTEDYTTRAFGNLKSGVGLVIDLSGPHRLGHVSISSPTKGWSVQVRTVDGSVPDTLEGWGATVASASNIRGDVNLSLNDVAASSVLLWITDLGDETPAHVEITEVGFSSE
jgi:serine/threonine-protein kinase